jgi:porin
MLGVEEEGRFGGTAMVARNRRMRSVLLLAAGVSIGGSVGPSTAHAQDAKPDNGIPDPSIATSLPHNGDPYGRRAALANRGITYGVNYTGEVFGVADGGISRGSHYHGLLETILNIDFEKLAGWRGLTFKANAFQIHGTPISAEHIGLLNPVSNIEATPATRLFELWFEQVLVKDKLTVRVGQQRVDADGEFINSPVAGLFLHTNFGWPVFIATNLPSGGVSYPLAAPGVRLKYTPTDKWTFLAAVFNDDPAGPCAGDPQKCNSDGLRFRVQDDPFVIGEVQYKYADGKQPGGLSGTFKLGAFVDMANFDDQRFGTDGLSLADPLSNGIPRRHRHDHGVYAVIDQQLYRPAGGGPTDGIYAFGRIAGLPADRNLVDFAFDIGLRFNGMVRGRPADEFGIAFAHSRISRRAVGLDRDAAVFAGLGLPVRSSESLVELTYKAQIIPGWTIQPDLQYIWRPGGNAPDPNDPTRPIDDALVLGVRSAVNY